MCIFLSCTGFMLAVKIPYFDISVIYIYCHIAFLEPIYVKGRQESVRL